MGQNVDGAVAASLDPTRRERYILYLKYMLWFKSDISAFHYGHSVMRLTTFTDYCLRTLMYVGAKGDELSTIDEIAESYGVSRNHLSKVVFRLAQLGFLETVRGKGGGMRLACPPEAVNLGKLVRSTEDDLELVECFGTTNANCCIDSACLLRKVLRDALSAFFEVLDDYTLADLLKPKRRLRRLLHISASP